MMPDSACGSKSRTGEIGISKGFAQERPQLAEGKFTRTDLTREQAVARLKQEAEEMVGGEFDASKVKGAMTLYQIEAAQGRDSVGLK